MHKLKLNTAECRIQSEIVINTKWISPGEAKCPKRSSGLNVEGREKAEKERHSLPVLREIQTGNNVNRDETVTLHSSEHHGHKVYEAKIHRKPQRKPHSHRK